MIQINKSVEVITVHEINGAMTPLRFRVDSEDGMQVCKLKIKTVNKYKDKLTYRCITVINDQQREVELHYLLQETKWILANIR